MYWVHPIYLLESLGGVDVQINDHGFVAAAHQDAFEWSIAESIDLLVGNEGRYKNKITGLRPRGEFQSIAPAHARRAAHDVNDTFQRAVVMRAGLGVRLNGHSSRPQLL